MRALAALVCLAGPCWGQVSGSLRTRLEAWDLFENVPNSTYAYSGSLLRVSFGQSRPALDWQIEAAMPVLLGLPETTVGVGANYWVANQRSTNAAMPFIKQGFLRWKNGEHSVRLGRFEFVEGSEGAPRNPTVAAVKRDRVMHRLLGNFGWTHVGRSLDGLHYQHAGGGHNFTFVGARPTRGVFQVDGWGELDIAVLYAGYTREMENAQARLFGIYYDDWRSVVKTDNRGLAQRRAETEGVRIGAVGGHYVRAIREFDLLLWGNLQTGSWGKLDHRAGAAAAEAGYQPAGMAGLRPWIRAGFHYGSGDGDAGDGKHTTFFQFLPTPRLYSRFPIYNVMNTQDGFVQLMLRPAAGVMLRSELHHVRLSEVNDLYYQGGGAFQPWTFGYGGRASGGVRKIATIWDFSADWQVNPSYSIGVYYARAFGKGQFGFVELTRRF